MYTAQPIPWSKPGIGDEELAEIREAFAADWLTMGPKVRRFEQAMAQRLGAKHAIAVTNGSVAIEIALLVTGIKPGDEVIVPSMTYFATAAAVNRVGAVPVFVAQVPDLAGPVLDVGPMQPNTSKWPEFYVNARSLFTNKGLAYQTLDRFSSGCTFWHRDP